MVFPAVGIEVTLISGNDASMIQVFGQNDQRGIGKIHRQIRIALHEHRHAGQFGLAKGENLEQTIPLSQEKFRRWSRSTTGLQEIAGVIQSDASTK